MDEYQKLIELIAAADDVINCVRAARDKIQRTQPAKVALALAFKKSHQRLEVALHAYKVKPQ